MRCILAIAAVVALSGCATPLRSYSPAGSQAVTYYQGVGVITWRSGDAVLAMYPTIEYQSPDDNPSFTLVVRNASDHSIDFVPENITVFADKQPCYVFTMKDRIKEITASARAAEFATMVAGGLAAAGAAYEGSHSTSTYSTVGMVGRRPVVATGTTQTYDPAAGMQAGAAVAAQAGAASNQIANAAAYEMRAAQAIFQHTTIPPGATMAGQVMIKLRNFVLDAPTPGAAGHYMPYKFNTLRFDVPIEQAQAAFVFTHSDD